MAPSQSPLQGDDPATLLPIELWVEVFNVLLDANTREVMLPTLFALKGSCQSFCDIFNSDSYPFAEHLRLANAGKRILKRFVHIKYGDLKPPPIGMFSTGFLPFLMEPGPSIPLSDRSGRFFSSDLYLGKRPSWQIYDLTLDVVRRNGFCLEFAPVLTEDLCLEAVRKTPGALQVVPPHHQTSQVCLEAIRRDGTLLQCVHSQTYAICLAAVQQDYKALEFVHPEHRTHDLYRVVVKELSTQCSEFVGHAWLSFYSRQCPEFWMVAVQEDGMNLQWVPKDGRTPLLCRAAVQQNTLAAEFVPGVFRWMLPRSKAVEKYT